MKFTRQRKREATRNTIPFPVLLKESGAAPERHSVRQMVNSAKGAFMVLPLFAATVVVLSAQTFQTLYSFGGQSGVNPLAGLIQAQDGELYGATTLISAGYDGTLFKITTSAKLTTLDRFCDRSGCPAGAGPEAAPIQTPSGDLYGTTSLGGAYGEGTVYRMTPDGTLTTLYSFCAQSGCADGAGADAGLLPGPDGAFYGATVMGGAYGTVGLFGTGGTIFKITPDGMLTTLYSFCAQSGCADGSSVDSALVWGADGELYGTTNSGGAYNQGTIFKITPSGTLTTLYSFCAQSGCPDGSSPIAGLVQAANGDLYGTTFLGGASNSGTLFKITPGGALSTLVSFCAACPVGWGPAATLIQATDGALYGTTSGNGYGVGAVFKLAPNGTLTTLHSFPGGGGPQAGLVQDTNGVFYGTTFGGGVQGVGSVFSLSVGLGPFVAPQTTWGKVGESVKILGTNLTDASRVTFNGAAAQFTVNEAGAAISATVPAGASTGSIEVSTPIGTLSSNVPFRVLP